MKIIVTSDIHRKKEIIDYILYNYDADYYCDCGDSELLNKDLKKFYSVLGNCDYDSYPNYRIININEKNNIFITHGHLYTINEMINMAKLRKCNIIIHGHTHIKKLEKHDEFYIVNPGSIAKPRSEDSNTFLMIDINEENNKINFEFIKIIL